MKYILIISFLLFSGSYKCKAQKYILLDKQMSQPPFYSNQITVLEKYKGFFPVEKKDIGKFVEVLEEISKRLSSKKITGKAKEYQVGCNKFSGQVIQRTSEDHLDYVIISTCDDIKITMHLSDAKLSNENNAFFINTWISYIKRRLK